MIEGLRPYPEMQSTGHPWLPSIPAHWEVRRNGRLFSERRETGYPDLPILEVSLRSGVRIRDMEGGKRKQQIADRSVYQRAVKGDIAYNMMRMWQGAVGIAPADGLVSPAYVVATAHDGVDAAYYAYLFRTDDYMKEIDSFSRGIVPDRNRLYWQAFKQMPSAYPPLDEQRLIVRFLDWHGAMTGKLIRAKRRLIALLNEQKQSIIYRAVTRGLDPAARLKPSGVDWLGEVPEHWEVKRIRDTVRSIIGGVWGEEPQGEGDVPCVRVADFDRSNLSVAAKPSTLRSFSPSELNGRILERGDLLIEKSGGGDAQSVGCVVIYDSDAPAVCSNFVARAVVKEDCNSRFLLLVHSTLYQTGAVLRSIKQTTGIQNLDLSSYLNERLALPTLAEQCEIVKSVYDGTAGIEAAMQVTHKEIALLQEFRTRLIADVVTGQLDVRAVAANLPEIGEADTADLTADDDMDDDADDLIDEEEAA